MMQKEEQEVLKLSVGKVSMDKSLKKWSVRQHQTGSELNHFLKSKHLFS